MNFNAKVQILSMEKSTLIKQLNERVDEYSKAIETNCIEYASFIVEVGALTVTTDAKGQLVPQNVLYPTQFSETAVEEIKNLNWIDGNNRTITPKTFLGKHWYRNKIEELKETLKLLQEQEYPTVTNA